MSEYISGIIHVHSTFSRDGLCSIADLADFARAAGLRFVGLTDHAEDLSLEDMKNFRRQCSEHSNESSVMVPGIEFRCDDDVHILGIGIAEHILSNEAVTVASEIRARAGLAILAHPGRNHYHCPPKLCSVLNGIEIWNAAYDGRFVPPLANLRLLQQVCSWNPALFGFGGADLHGLQQTPGVLLELQVDGRAGVDTPMVLQYLRCGRFSVRGTYVSFDARRGPHPLAYLRLWAFRRLYDVSKAMRDVALGRG